MTSWQTVIGLEVHAQLSTQSKLFSPAATTFGASANAHTSYIDAGLPGVLPVLNQQAVKLAVQFGLAIDASINDCSFFERKNYFYPDLPKGYQISQYQRPIVSQGQLEILLPDNKVKHVEIVRAHLEEDAGKSLHDIHADATGIDLNRAGIPLLEIVTAPCLYSAVEVVTYLKTLHQLLRFLGICDGNMQEGSFRCDVNLSLRPTDSKKLGTRTELKNLNSFRFIEKAIMFEQQRHQDLLESGQKIVQETRLYCPNTNSTQVMRSKENENDYRYFPDPDLLPIKLDNEDIKRIKATLKPLPKDIRQYLLLEDNLSFEDAELLLTDPALVNFYNAVKSKTHASKKTVVNWIKGHYLAMMHELGANFNSPPVSAQQLALLLDRLTENVISAKLAKTIFMELLKSTQSVDELIAASGFKPIEDNAKLLEMIKDILAKHPQQAADLRAGKEKLLAFFVGQIMKQTKGQADPALINKLLKQCLTEQS